MHGSCRSFVRLFGPLALASAMAAAGCGGPAESPAGPPAAVIAAATHEASTTKDEAPRSERTDLAGNGIRSAPRAVSANDEAEALENRDETGNLATAGGREEPESAGPPCAMMIPVPGGSCPEPEPIH